MIAVILALLAGCVPSLIVTVQAPQAGTYYVKIDHGENDDASYRLSYSSVNVGTVGFVNGGSYTVSEDAALCLPMNCLALMQT